MQWLSVLLLQLWSAAILLAARRYTTSVHAKHCRRPRRHAEGWLQIPRQSLISLWCLCCNVVAVIDCASVLLLQFWLVAIKTGLRCHISWSCFIAALLLVCDDALKQLFISTGGWQLCMWQYFSTFWHDNALNHSVMKINIIAMLFMLILSGHLHLCSSWVMLQGEAR